MINNEEEPLRRVKEEIEEHSRKHRGEITTATGVLTELHHSLETLEEQNTVIERQVIHYLLSHSAYS